MKNNFGHLLDGTAVSLYTISDGGISAVICDLGASVYRLYVPDHQGHPADVVLGFPDPMDYVRSTSFMGCVIGRSANRLQGAAFRLNGREYRLEANENGHNNLHSGNAFYKDRVWTVLDHTATSISLVLDSPDGDQGYPGNAKICVTYTIENGRALRISYDGICDRDTVFNMTNHTYFNLAGHDHPEKAMQQILSMPARFFTPSDAESIPTGECLPVEGTPMDFRCPKPIGQDIGQDYAPLHLQGGYDHNFEAFANPCATLSDPESGRSMAVITDCPGIQLYSGNFLNGESGKDGAVYCRRGGVCLETQFFPNALNHPEWDQPIVHAGERYHSDTVYRFVW